jgi:serine/threonine protein kinase
MNAACGTPGYVAPEILKGLAYGKEVDMWSIGVILYILLCGFPPFYDDNNKKLFAQIVSASYTFPEPYWTSISASAKDLVHKLLVVDAHRRLTAPQVLAHPWMHEEGSDAPLDHFKENLKSYNARRRFRSAIRAVQISQLLRNRTKGGKAPPSILEAVEEQDNARRSKSIENSALHVQGKMDEAAVSFGGNSAAANTAEPALSRSSTPLAGATASNGHHLNNSN